MTQTRSMLLIAWLFLAGWLWLQWNEFDAAPAATTTAVTATGSPATPVPAQSLPSPAATLPSAGALPDVELPGGITSDNVATDAPVLRLRNDVLELAIDAHGNVVDSHLLGYQQEKKVGSPDVQLLRSSDGQRYVAGAGLIQSPDGRQQVPLAIQFRPVDGKSDVRLADGAAALSVPLQWTDPVSGLQVQRTLTLARGSYLLTMQDSLVNNGTGAQRVWPYVDLARTAPPTPGKLHGFTNPEAFSFTGAAWYTPEEKFAKTPLTDYDDEKPPIELVTGGWIGLLQHHFVTAWVPGPEDAQMFTLSQDSSDGLPMYRIRSVARPIDIAPGAKASRQARLWVGPKLQKQLETIAPGLKLSLDYGKVTFIAQPLFDYVLKPLHALTRNWGWAIILTVLLLKLALYPLSAAQFRSMAKMRAVQPRIEALKERYGSGQEYQVAMMELYKKEKINPVGGCLPMLIPLPIMFALYWVLLETVELRHAPWIGWIQNLTAPDPYFVLPVLNLAVMYLTQK
ncbi:MAG: membrane protein insertase YidC, partial [Arenimonas sp.]